MHIKDFYRLSSKLVSSTVQVHAIGLTDFSPIDPDRHYDHDQNKLIHADYSGIAFPVEFRKVSGKKLLDILDTGWANLYIISKKMKTVLEDNELTGWKTFEVNILDKSGQEIRDYYGFSIIGTCGTIDYGKSEIIEKRLIPNGPLSKYYKGLYVGLDQWDGNDFFLPKEYSCAIITNKSMEILKKNKITNVRFSNLSEIEIAV